MNLEDFIKKLKKMDQDKEIYAFGDGGDYFEPNAFTFKDKYHLIIGVDKGKKKK